MGPLAKRERPLPEAGELLAVEALDRAGVLVTSEGALVRFLRVAPKNPLVMSDSERAQVSHAFGQLVARVGAGQSLQFYVEAAPVRLDALLEHSRGESERGRVALEQSGERELRDRAGALRRRARAAPAPRIAPTGPIRAPTRGGCARAARRA